MFNPAALLLLATAVQWPVGDDFGRLPTRYFLVGLALERGADNVVGEDVLGDQLWGLSVDYGWPEFSLGVRLMISANVGVERFQEIRMLAGLDARVHERIFGIDVSYGLGVHTEARLDDHFWLTYFTPAELGVTVFEVRTLVVRLYLGLRRLAHGQLIESFLVDPNGFDNENVADALQAERDQPWEGFVRLVFARAL